jgi:hypothetical protein
VLEQTRLEHEVELKVQDNEIIISAPQKARAGWEDSFRELAKKATTPCWIRHYLR